MIENEQDFSERRPQRLCKMCGKCCRVATSSLPHAELVRRSEAGDREAWEFLDTFTPFETLEDAMAMDKDTVLNIPDYQNRTFYTCKHLKGNICGRYLERHDVCKRFPNSPWAIHPPNCGFEGWLFQEREKIMKYIRGLKEEQMEYRMMLKSSPQHAEKLEQLISSIDRTIKLFDKYGSEYW